MILDFNIASSSDISKAFTDRGIDTFSEACTFVRQLKYGRNADKDNLLSVFSDNCGTCSTKHALLNQLALDNGYTDFKLMIGLYKMHAINTPKIGTILRDCGLDYLPEAHCYLRWDSMLMDLTMNTSESINFQDDVLEEIEISPNQINAFKVQYHKDFLKDWLSQHPHIHYSLEELWWIRYKICGVNKISEIFAFIKCTNPYTLF